MEYLMDGVEVLSKSEIMKLDFCWWAFLVCIAVGISLSILSKKYITTIIIGSLSFFVGLVSSFEFSENIPTGKYTYKVTISDEVNFNDFNSKYDVISQDGKIYTIKEKDNKQHE